MDGRVQLPVIGFLRDRFGVDYVDSVTEPGPNGILATGLAKELVESILQRVRISVEEHGSVGVAVVGHYDCAGNPGPKEQQVKQVRASVVRLTAAFPGTDVIGLWVDEAWQTHEIC
jgi:hypothetical protein